jgi:hypothetical protein
MQRSWPLTVMVALVIAVGGCAAGVDQPGQEAAEGTPDAAELTSEQTSVRAVGEPGWMAGDIVGLVTKVSHNTNGHFVTVGRDDDGHARRDTRGKRCAGMVLEIFDDTRVLRGPEGDTPASAADVEEGQKVLASPGDAMAGPCPPLVAAEKIVILGPG